MRDIHMSTERFVNQVKEGYDSNLRYCFILGSGASYTSGIPTGLQLMPKWREYLQNKGMDYTKECARDCGVSQEKVEQLFAPDYKLKSEDYFAMFDLRYAGMPIVAYHDLQELMEKAEPSIGYYMLAVLMDNTENKLVITTNFDSLVEDVLYMYHAKHPLVAGHESLAPFIGTVENMGRPVVAKVHRDLTLQPLNRERELQKLAEAWAESLRTALSKYIPIVIGYSGGDQTLMNLLEKTKLDSIYWCSLYDSESERIEKLIKGCPRGYLVKIDGFDEVMLSLISSMTKGKDFDSPAVRMKTLFESRLEHYNEQYIELNKKLTGEETSRNSGDGKLSPKPAGTDMAADSSGKGEPATDSSADTVESWIDLLDKMASTESTPALKAASLRREAYKYLYRKDYEKALENIDKAIAIQPDNADLHNLKGVILNNSGRYEEALKEKDEAVRLAPDNASYHDSRGVTLDWLERYEEALREHDKAVKIAPDNASYHDSRGVTLHQLERYEEALEESNEAVRLDPYNAVYYNTRSVILYRLKRYEEALEDSNKALGIDPNNADYHESRSVALHELGRYMEALEESDEAVHLIPDNAKFHDSRGRTLRKLGRIEEAQKEFDKADSLDPDNKRYELGRMKSE